MVHQFLIAQVKSTEFREILSVVQIAGKQPEIA